MKKFFKPNQDGLLDSSVDYSKIRSGLLATPQYVDIDLTTARSVSAGTALPITLGGNMFYVDGAPTVGNATVYFNPQGQSAAQHLTPFFIQPGFIAKVPFIVMLLENAAQPGKIMRIIYGTDIEFVPGASMVTQISGTVTVSPSGGVMPVSGPVAGLVVEQRGIGFTGSFFNGTTSVANTPIQLIAPGVNVNGIDLYTLNIWEAINALPTPWTVLAKASTPTTVSDGDVILSPNGAGSMGGTYTVFGALDKPVRIGAGKGLYYWPQSASWAAGTCSRSGLYEIL